MKDKMLEYLAGHNFCVISTVDNDQPEAAFVGFSFSPDLGMMIGTSKKSRKYKNILQNKRIALAIGDFNGTVQYEGIAEEIVYEEYEELVKQRGFRELPNVEKYRNDPTETWIKITPTWIRFTRHGVEDNIEEFTEFDA